MLRGTASVSGTGGRGMATLEQRLRDAAKARLAIGIPAGAHEPDGTSSAQVGRWMEFGTWNAPARPWLSTGIRRAFPGIKAINRRSLAAVMEGRMSVDQALGLAGVYGAGVVKQTIVDGPWVPNAPSTIKAKGSDKPLIDSAYMKNNVTYQVER